MISQAMDATGGSRQFYDSIAESYDLERFGCRCGSILNDTELNIIAGLVPHGSRVLDAGAGTGRFSFEMARVGSNVVAIDTSREMTNHALIKERRANIPGSVWFVLGDVASLPFSSGAFDAVICVKLLSHYRDTTRYIGEMARVLRSGGKLILDAPNTFARTYRRFVRNRGIRSSIDYFHSISELEGIFRRHSISITRRLTYSALPSSLVHLAICRRPRLASDEVLRTIYSSRKGFLSFIEGTKLQ